MTLFKNTCLYIIGAAQTLCDIAVTLRENLNVTKDILHLWKMTEIRNVAQEQRQIESHAISMQLFKMNIAMLERNAQEEKERREQYEKYVKPILRTGVIPTDSIGE